MLVRNAGEREAVDLSCMSRAWVRRWKKENPRTRPAKRKGAARAPGYGEPGYEEYYTLMYAAWLVSQKQAELDAATGLMQVAEMAYMSCIGGMTA